ncbi:MAG: acyl carrier protein [Pseudohongiellaceae bacterium]|nr:acyl carrier protein [Pseudohongiellaceae bacterium]
MEREIQSTVIQLLRSACKDSNSYHGSIIPELTLEQLGMDSLKLVEVIYELERSFGLQVAEEEILELQYVSDLIALVDPSYRRNREAI